MTNHTQRKEHTVAGVRTLDHVGITVADLEPAIAFFESLGLVVEGRTFLEGPFVDDVIGIPDSRSEICVLRAPSGGTGVELSCFVRPDHEPGQPTALSTVVGLRNICFEVEDLPELVERLDAEGYGLVGTVGRHEGWLMTYVRGPEGIIVALAEPPTGATD
jgi:catechol 2,3-dioxygenase-like lactoylglutathione lyase family enzyme